MITRDDLVKVVDELFPSLDIFFQVMEEGGPTKRFICTCSIGECVGNGDIYIIDTKTDLFVGWYKLYHIGRGIHSNITGIRDLYDFMNTFKECAEEDLKDDNNN
jgi:hypothetical protein